MKASSFPTLHGQITNAERLKIEIAKAVSQVQIYTARTSLVIGSVTFAPQADPLRAVLQYAIDQLTGITDVASIALTPDSITLDLSLAQTQQLVATATMGNADTEVVTTATGITYVSSNVLVATVSAGGLVTPVGVGTATITATYRGVASDAQLVTVVA